MLTTATRDNGLYVHYVVRSTIGYHSNS